MKNQVLLTAGLLAGSALSYGQEKPNIVIIYSDDMGVGDVSYINSKWVSTPNIDRLAAEGRVMSHYYTASPVSSPSRVSLTTGMFPSQWGINTFLHEREKNRKHEQFDYLDPNAPSMARSLKADAGEDLQAKDTRNIIRHNMKLAGLPPIDLTNPKHVEHRVKEYFKICDEDNIKPHIPGLAIACGTTAQYLWRLRSQAAAGNLPKGNAEVQAVFPWKAGVQHYLLH